MYRGRAELILTTRSSILLENGADQTRFLSQFPIPTKIHIMTLDLCSLSAGLVCIYYMKLILMLPKGKPSFYGCSTYCKKVGDIEFISAYLLAYKLYKEL